MKGGVTSGLVYPAAIAEIAKTYRIRSIGGTSAGAIAAAAAAAMEYGIRTGRSPTAAREQMAALASELGNNTSAGTSKLQAMFAADAATRPLLDAAMSAQRHGPAHALMRLFWPQYWMAVLAALVACGWLWLMPQDGPDLAVYLAVTGWYFALGALVAATRGQLGLGVWFWPALAGLLLSTPGFALPVYHRLLPLLVGVILGTASDLLLSRDRGAGLSIMLGFGLLAGLSVAGRMAGELVAPSGLLGGLVFVLAALAVMLQRAAALLDAVKANGLGLCTGSAAPDALCRSAPVPSLIGWLHEQIQSLAGLDPTSRNAPKVLTFGDLCGGDGDAKIDLVLMATDLNRLQSVRFPALPQHDRLFFEPCEWQRLFPADVMAHLKDHAPPLPERGADGAPFDGCDVKQAADALGKSCCAFQRLPAPADLPVLVAVRASMAFPGLFTPLPLWLLRWVPDECCGPHNHGPPPARPVFTRVYLSDGGITSNFPIHLFDAPVPGRPTFAINLAYPDDQLVEEYHAELSVGKKVARPSGVLGHLQTVTDGAPAQDWVFMPASNRGLISYYKALEAPTGLAAMMKLLLRVVETARVWNDVGQFPMPGVRDRIAHVKLAAHEGGFNLGMDADVIGQLASKGAAAGKALAQRFHPTSPNDLWTNMMPRLNWHNHRYVRLRSTLDAQHRFADEFGKGWRPGTPKGQQTPPLQDLVQTADGTYPPGGAAGAFPIGYSANMTAPDRQDLKTLSNAIETLGHLTASATPSAPEPLFALRMRRL